MRSNDERIGQLLDRLLNKVSSASVAQLQGFQTLLNYVAISTEWDSNARSGIRGVETDEGTKLGRTLDIRRNDRAGAISILRVNRNNGTEFTEVSIGRMDTAEPFIVSVPESLRDWQMLTNILSSLDGKEWFSDSTADILPTDPDEDVDQDDDSADTDEGDPFSGGVQVFSSLSEAIGALTGGMGCSCGGKH